MALPIIAAAGASALGGILGFIANMSAAERAEALQDKALQELIAIQIPDLKDQEIALEKFIVSGELTPEMEQAVAQAPSAFEKIQVDPSLKQAQMRALKEMEQIGYQGGLRLQDKAALQEVQNKAAQQERSNREALMQRFAAQGQGGSGFELQAQMAAQQGGADRQAMGGLSVAAEAQRRALDAIMKAGQLGGDIRGQEYGMERDRASAADAIARFNTENLRSLQSRNVGARNEAQRYNLANKQDIANKNVGLSNQAQIYNKELMRQNYEDQLRKQQLKQGIYGQQGQMELNKGQMWGNLAGQLGQAGSNTILASSAANQNPLQTTAKPKQDLYGLNDDDDWFKRSQSMA